MIAPESSVYFDVDFSAGDTAPWKVEHNVWLAALHSSPGKKNDYFSICKAKNMGFRAIALKEQDPFYGSDEAGVNNCPLDFFVHFEGQEETKHLRLYLWREIEFNEAPNKLSDISYFHIEHKLASGVENLSLYLGGKGYTGNSQ